MRLGIKGFLILFTLYFGLCLLPLLALADEPKAQVEINCEPFLNQDICNMTAEEQELFFLEILQKILDDTIENKKEGLDV